MSKEGTITANLESIAWVEIDGRPCWAVKLIVLFNGIPFFSYPSRHYKESSKRYVPLPVLVIILEEYDEPPLKGQYKYPHVYELSYHVMLNKKEQVRKKDPKTGRFIGGIQGSRLDGYFVGVNELYLYRTRTQEEAEEENMEVLKKAIRERDEKFNRFKKNTEV